MFKYTKCFMSIAAVNDVPLSNFRIYTRIKKLLNAVVDSRRISKRDQGSFLGELRKDVCL